MHACLVQVIAVASKGGQSLREAVKRMMFTLFTNDLCRLMNWTGGKFNKEEGDENDGEDSSKKTAFKDLQCRRVLES